MQRLVRTRADQGNIPAKTVGRIIGESPSSYMVEFLDYLSLSYFKEDLEPLDNPNSRQLFTPRNVYLLTINDLSVLWSSEYNKTVTQVFVNNRKLLKERIDDYMFYVLRIDKNTPHQVYEVVSNIIHQINMDTLEDVIYFPDF